VEVHVRDPAALAALVAEPVGQQLLGREIRARIAAFARACGDAGIVAVAEGAADPGPAGAARPQ